ncbi:hypothetical protein BT63DRAFT_360155, partial [Microthyrium microscopicum]
RWVLVAQAVIWRFLMQIGMFLHKFASPRPAKPDFVRTFKTTVAEKKGEIKLHFYVPADWHKEIKGFAGGFDGRTWPVVVNFHGGGFTLGKATDDARWCETVVREVDAICVSVDYRLAPEHAFPTAVEDGADSILYLVAHAAELGIDVDRIAVSGFSAGANMCFTVPLRLEEELNDECAFGEDRRNSSNKGISIKVVVAWYPPVDYTRTREEKRSITPKIHQLPAMFTDLFDDSYLSPPTMDMSQPYLSPGVAPRHLLAGLPQEIMIFACEYDMLLDEAIKFTKRLREEVNKTVHYFLVEGAAHGFDKAPNPIRQPKEIKDHYSKACREMKRLL